MVFGFEKITMVSVLPGLFKKEFNILDVLHL